MSVPAYPTYKDSGVEWLGEVPAHWDVSGLKRLFEIIGGTTPKADNPDFWDGGIPWATPTDLGSSGSFTIAETGRTISEAGLASCGTTMVPPGSIILSTRAPIGSLGISGVSLCTNQGCKSLVPIGQTHSSFFAHLLSASTAELNIRGSGSTFLELSGDKLGAFQVPVPPPVEQAAIAAFLDLETGKIDALVEEQRRLIALLKEKRQAVISHAVTKGLNPQAPLKPSGIEWLGDIPAHWDSRPVWLMFSLGRGRVMSHEYIAEFPGPYPVYSSQTENDGVMGHIGTFDFDGDYLTWTTDGAHAGTVFRRSGKFNCTNVCGTLRPKIAMDLDFMQAALADATGYYVRHDINPKLMNNVMASIRVPVPPVEEQRLIAQHVVDSIGGFELIIRTAEAAMTLLQERRAALISAAVTGKIDVRALVATPGALEAA